MVQPVRTSAFSSRIIPGSNSAQLRRLGWAQADIRSLLRVTRDISINLGQLTQDRFSLHVTVDQQKALIMISQVAAGSAGTAMDLTVNLTTEPAGLLKTLPLNLCLTLAKQLLDMEHKTDFLMAFARTVPNGKQMLTELIDRTEHGYWQHKGVEFHPGQARDFFHELIQGYGPEAMKWKLTADLMAPRQLPPDKVGQEFDQLTADLRTNLRQTDLSKQIPIWSVVSALAMISVVAAENNRPDLSRKAQEMLSNEFGRDLAATELLSYDIQDTNMFTRIPFMVEKQMMNSIDLYHFIFNQMQILLTLVQLNTGSILAEMSGK